jgi:hypothetical protein
VDILTKLGYIDIGEIWYDFAGQLKPFNDDFAAIGIHLCTWLLFVPLH